MSLLLVTYTECEATLKAAADQAGQKVRCPRCGAALVVPSANPRLRVVPEEDIPEEDPLLRRKGQRRRRSRTRIPPWAVVAGVVAGVLLMGLGVGLAVWAMSAGDPRETIIGSWESTDQPSAGTIEFHRDGTFVARTQESGTINAKYRFLDDKTLELEVPNPVRPLQEDLMGRLRLPQSSQPRVPETLRGTAMIVKLNRSVLVTRSNSDGTKHFRRIR